MTDSIGLRLKVEVSMYAIIRTGGKQYKVQPGDTLRVEKLEKEQELTKS